MVTRHMPRFVKLIPVSVQRDRAMHLQICACIYFKTVLDLDSILLFILGYLVYHGFILSFLQYLYNIFLTCHAGLRIVQPIQAHSRSITEVKKQFNLSY